MSSLGEWQEVIPFLRARGWILEELSNGPSRSAWKDAVRVSPPRAGWSKRMNRADITWAWAMWALCPTEPDLNRAVIRATEEVFAKWRETVAHDVNANHTEIA